MILNLCIFISVYAIIDDMNEWLYSWWNVKDDNYEFKNLCWYICGDVLDIYKILFEIFPRFKIAFFKGSAILPA